MIRTAGAVSQQEQQANPTRQQHKGAVRCASNVQGTKGPDVANGHNSDLSPACFALFFCGLPGGQLDAPGRKLHQATVPKPTVDTLIAERDGQCGPDVDLRCDPRQPAQCCSATFRCGNELEHCSMKRGCLGGGWGVCGEGKDMLTMPAAFD
jgi:hypothetical protein